MKTFGAVFSLFMTASSFLAASYLYVCVDERSMLTFSDTSITGKAVLRFDNTEGDSFYLNGDQFTLQKNSKNFEATGLFSSHPRYIGFYVSFPIIDADSGAVTANFMLKAANGMPPLKSAYQCEVKKVQF